YFVSDDELRAFFNDAVKEAALRGRLIHESADRAVCVIKVTAGKAVYPLHASLYELTYSAYRSASDARRVPLLLASTEVIDRALPDWRERQETPCYAIQDDRSLRVVPTPLEDGEVLLEGYRLPKAELEGDDDEP